MQKPGQIVAQKGKHQVGSIVSAERGTSVTCACCVSTHGNFLPPFLFFKRKKLRPDIREGAPPGTGFAVQDKGWMDRDIFVQWLEHFIRHSKPPKEAPVLLILDGYVSHTGYLKIELLCFLCRRIHHIECSLWMLAISNPCQHISTRLQIGGCERIWMCHPDMAYWRALG